MAIGDGVIVLAPGWEQLLAERQNAYFDQFVQRPEFTALYPTTMTPAQFVDTLNAKYARSHEPRPWPLLTNAERDALVNDLQTGARSRAQALRRIAEDSDFHRREFNRAFVLMQYFGYLRRNPNDAPDNNMSGYNFWLQKLKQFGGNFINAEMVRAFISSIEYRSRFGP